MPAKPRNTRQEQQQLAAALRAEGATWAQVAAEFSRRYRVNARVALRLAHGWSQPEAAEGWNARWPDTPKTFKNFSAWEQWPGPTGYAPSLSTLDRLAQLYECHIADVLRDQPDYSTASGCGPAPPPSGGSLAPADAERLLSDLLGQAPRQQRGQSLSLPQRSEVALLHRLNEIEFHELAKVIMVWSQWLNPLNPLSRRSALSKLGAAFTLAAASPLLDLADRDELERVARVLADPSRLDEATLSYAETALPTYRRQANVLGPQATLPIVLAQRQAAARFADAAPERLRSRALAVYADLSQLVGWQLFNLGDGRSAQRYYEEARTAAHEAQFVELVAYALCSMTHLAVWQGKPRVGMDHVVAAEEWASKSSSRYARGCAADFAARAYAANRQEGSCRAALDVMRESGGPSEGGGPAPSWAFTLSESFYWSIRGECALRLGKPAEALAVSERSLSLMDPTDMHNYLHTFADQAEAHAQQSDPDSASRVIGEILTLAEGYPARRLQQRIMGMRAGLEPWRRTKTVRELDERLAHYRLSAGGGSEARV